MIFQVKQEEIPEIRPLLKKPVQTGRPIKKPPKGGRWTIIALFLFTCLTSAFFLFYPKVLIIWEKISAPLIINDLPAKKIFDPSLIKQQIDDLTRNLRGTYGVYVYRFGDQNEYGVHQKEVFPAASLMKLPAILTLYQETEKNNLELEVKYPLREKDKVYGAGVLQGKPAGTNYTYRELAELMGQHSDNTAFGIIRKVVGDQKIQQTIDQLGMTDTSLKKFETTPKDIGLFFRQLYGGGVVTSEYKEEILKLLTKTAFEDWIPAGIPVGTRVAHKIGQDIGTFSDGGIIFGPKPFVLVILSKDARESEAKEVLPKISRAVWEFENSQ